MTQPEEDHEDSWNATNKKFFLEAGTIFSSIGYTAQALPHVPFDEETQRISQENLSSQEYVTGWAKRGATGGIGENKKDAMKTVQELLQHLIRHPPKTSFSVKDYLEEKGIAYVTFKDWKLLDTHEILQGRLSGKIREKVTNLETMLKIAHVDSHS